MHPRPRALPTRGLLLAIGLLLPAVAAADDTHYQNFIVGSRAIGLGGAFTAIADDPSGLYYNPAGLAEIRHSSLQISSSLYGFERGSVGGASSPIPGIGDNQVNIDTALADLVIVPAAFGVAHAFGPEGTDGRPYQSWALTILVPSFHSSTLTEDTRSRNRSTTYSRQLLDRSIWAGIGYGRKFDQRLMLGLSGFYKMRAIEGGEETSSTGAKNRAGDASFLIGSSKLKLFNGSMLFNIGAKYRVTDHLTLGASVMPPSIPINSGGTFSYNRGTSDPAGQPGGRSEYLRQGATELGGDAAVNFQGRIGAAYIVPGRLTAALDVSFFAPVDYTLIDISDAALERALPVVPDVQRNFVANVNLGFEYLFYQEFSAALGAFTDFSSAPFVKTDAGGKTGENQLERVNIFGGTFALGFFSDHSLTRIGVLYAAGNGDAVLPLDNSQWLLGGETQFQKVEIFRSFLYVFASGTYRF